MKNVAWCSEKCFEAIKIDLCEEVIILLIYSIKTMLYGCVSM